MACSVPKCRSRVVAFSALTKNDATNISFHRFPADIDQQETWVKNVRRGDEWRPNKHSRVCSLHFEESCYREGYGRRTLHSHAVPTIFPNRPLSCQPKLPKKRKLVARYSGETTTKNKEESLHSSVTKIDRSTQTEYVEETSINSELRKTMKLVDRFKRIAASRGKKLKNLQRQCSRLKQKNADLVTIINSRISLENNSLVDLMTAGEERFLSGDHELEDVAKVGLPLDGPTTT